MVLAPSLTLAILVAVMACVALGDHFSKAQYDSVINNGVPTTALVTACQVRNDTWSGAVCSLSVCYYTDGTAGPPESSADVSAAEEVAANMRHGAKAGWVSVPRAVYDKSPQGTDLPIKYLNQHPASFVVVGARPTGWPWPVWLLLGALCLASFWGLHRAVAK